MTMQMTEQEIVMDYKRAANHKEKIKILSELNACPKDEIERILRENGLMKYFLKNKDISAEIPKIMELINEGKRPKEIAEMYQTTTAKMIQIFNIILENDSVSEQAIELTGKIEKVKPFTEPKPDISEKMKNAIKTGGFVKSNNINTNANTKDITINISASDIIAGIKQREEFDNVNHPQHYCVNGLECLDIMKEVFGPDKVQAFCVLNAFKYLFRFQRKNGDEDIKKAHFYLGRYIELMEKESAEK